MAPDLSTDSIVDALITDEDPAEVTALTGFLREPTEGKVRLFLDPELKSWIDIPEEHIVHRRRIESGTAGEHTMIWVKNEWVQQPLLTAEQKDAIAEQFLIGEFAAEILLSQTLAAGLDYVSYALRPTTMCSRHCPK